ncbi:TonB-dependent receptor [Sphingorhabdus sp.]|uniref:TonB-dependent receptor n=1 Tax=Sphingorhabdus sp. TaxID=1902408 RepID=UPI0039830DA6
MKIAYPAAVAILCAAACPAFARDQNVNIPAQRLDSALIALGQQAQISLGGVDARLSSVRSQSVRGKMSIPRALQKMLRGTGFDFIAVDAITYRIVRADPKRAARLPKPTNPPTAMPVAVRPSPPELPVQEIIVTGGKQNQPLVSYPGTAHVETVGGTGMSENLGTAAFVARLPTLTSTNLGPGRNKIFIRGIADSSFSGPTQSTVGLYLGELRLTYNAPEPDLRLYDINRVEVIEGPQGTLYGAGALGGIIRIMPKTPDMGNFDAEASGGISSIKNGASGFDIAGMINIPLIDDHVALRVTGYRQIEGGYIDDMTRGKADVNRASVQGGRAILRIQPGSNWIIDLGGVIQNIDTRDNQYAELGLAKLTRAALIAQPHDNDFRAANVTVSKRWTDLDLLSSTSVVKHDLSERFDATGYQGNPGVLAYDASNKISLLTHETRLARSTVNGGNWVVGLSLLRSVNRIERSIGAQGAPVPLSTLRDERTEYAVFGEISQPIASDWSVTAGARLERSKSIGELIGGAGPDFEPAAQKTRVLPTAALSWIPRNDFIAFLRYQSGFRSGGIAINGSQLNSATRFESDELDTVELGFRLGGTGGGSRLSGGVTASYSNWRAIQADLISVDGLPYTANIGRGQILGLEANMIWRATDSLTLDGALFVNNSALTDPSLGLEDADSNALPNVAKTGGRASFAWVRPLSEALAFKLDGTVRYVGASKLSTIPPLNLEHGETVQVDMSAALDAGLWQISLDATNLLDLAGNSFSYGNPFSVGLGKQITPLRPRTVRLGVKFGF